MKTLNLVDNRANGGNLASGARNTKSTTVSDSRQRSVFYFQALTPGVAQNTIPARGEYALAVSLCGFSSYPAVFSHPESMISRFANFNSALEKRITTKGTPVFLHPLFGVPVVYPLTVVPAHHVNAQGVAA